MRAIWLACAGVLLIVSCATATELKLSAELDGDGRQDHVTLDRYEPQVLRVWLSATRTTRVLRSRRPIVGVVAIDLNGDGRPELIVTTATALRVWTNGRNGFHSYHPTRSTRAAIGCGSDRLFEDGPMAPQCPLPGFRPGLEALDTCLRCRAPTGLPSHDAPARVRGGTPASPLASSAPRPPPAPFI